jgi:hypothetical protein
MSSDVSEERDAMKNAKTNRSVALSLSTSASRRRGRIAEIAELSAEALAAITGGDGDGGPGHEQTTPRQIIDKYNQT